MKVTSIGHAGFFVETAHGSVLCDPWFHPAYFGSWFPFPSNEDVDLEAIARPTYLYVSHTHEDHFDPEFLREHVSRETTVLLPDHPLGLLERELRALGFTRFVHTRNGEPVDLDGLRVAIMATNGPSHGPLGDSSLILDDGEARLLNQNDARPVDLDALVELGPYDLHLLQYSGAIWYPMVYRIPEKMKQALARRKRVNQMDRAIRYLEHVGARHVVPSAGPPCFLDDALFELNDLDRDPTNIFPDQTVFLELLHERGHDHGLLMVPGSTVTVGGGECRLEHPAGEDEVQAIFSDKRAYLEAYRERQRPALERVRASWPREQVDVAAALHEWLEPLLQRADRTCAGINGRVLLDCGEQQVVLDFANRRVHAHAGESWDYRLAVDPALVSACIRDRTEDWVNRLFLSLRFEAERKGPYNEYLYSFFKCLSEERMDYVEAYYAEQWEDGGLFECGDYRVQRRCPHLSADLTQFGEVEDGVLTCTLHGWQFELATGRCLTSDDRRLYTERIAREAAA